MKNYLLLTTLFGLTPAIYGMEKASEKQEVIDLSAVLMFDAVRANAQAEATIQGQVSEFCRMHEASKTLGEFEYTLATNRPFNADSSEEWARLYATLKELRPVKSNVTIYSQKAVSCLNNLGISLAQGMGIMAQAKGSEHATKVVRETTTKSLDELRTTADNEQEFKNPTQAIQALVEQQDYICTVLKQDAQGVKDAVARVCSSQKEYAQHVQALSELLIKFYAKESELNYWYNLLFVVDKALLDETAFKERAKKRAVELKALGMMPNSIQDDLTALFPVRSTYAVKPDHAALTKYCNGLLVLLKSVNNKSTDGIAEAISLEIKQSKAELAEVKMKLIKEAPEHIKALQRALAAISDAKRPFENNKLALTCINGIEAAQVLSDMRCVRPLASMLQTGVQMIAPWHTLLMEENKVDSFHAVQTLTKHADFLTSIALKYMRLYNDVMFLR